MSLMWLIIIGVIAGAAAKLLMPQDDARGLFLLGIGGSIIAGTIQFAEGQPVGLVVPVVGAFVLLCTHAIVNRRPPTAETRSDDYRKAA